jgi:hypothetical protein
MTDMVTDNENRIREIIGNARVVQDPLTDLVQRTESDPGAPFEPEAIEAITELRRDEPAEYFRLRDNLKKRGISVRELDAATSRRHSGGTDTVRGTPDQTELLIELAETTELFHTADGTAYATVDGERGRETFEISDQGIGDWLRRRWFQQWRNAPSSEALRSALRTLTARAKEEGPQHEVYVRVAEYEGCYYLDLANNDGHVVKIGPERWGVIRSSPVRFVRPRGMLPLPMPEEGGSLIRDLFPLLNLQSEAQRVLVTLWLTNCLIASPNYRVLVLHGEQGAAKSRTSRTLRDLLDPNFVPLRAPPRNERELVISAINSHVLAFDNVSYLSRDMSDAFCRLSTGTGLAPRRLWTGREEELLTAVKPIILNGIEDFVTGEDLSDRAISITLQPIPSERRRTEAELRRALEERRAHILGGLLDVTVHGLRQVDQLGPKPLSRMADFDRFAMACETALWPAGTYERALNENRAEAVEAGIEADVLASAVLDLIAASRAVRAVDAVESFEGFSWRGTATNLLQELAELNSALVRNREWPKTPRALSGRLRRLAPLLRKKGIEVEFPGEQGHSNARMIYITAHPSAGPQPAPLAPLAETVEASDALFEEDGEVSVEMEEEVDLVEERPGRPPISLGPLTDTKTPVSPSRSPILVKRPKRKV